MSTIQEHRHVRICAAPEEETVVEIDGHDVASSVEAYWITQTVDEGTRWTGASSMKPYSAAMPSTVSRGS
ncbi:hypothetical protein [Streptomyces sp. WAC 06725]|uniref:hypothetical protein n=1 Tax=Streptomyces sp. WAC 06725 TaxID=2203209 RepID=UPI000F743BDF|nr:hypothetical protein [Streptomyces sp. WAC 06725]